MKKHTLMAGIVLGSIVLAGCKAQTPTATSDAATAQPTGTTEGGSTTDKMKSWADAVKLGGGLKCTITNTKTNTTSNYVAKGKKLHMKGFGMDADEKSTSGEMISDGSFMYTWDATKKEGFKMALPSEADIKKSTNQAKEAAKNAPETPDFTNEDSVKQLENEGFKMDCAPGVISDAEFVPPTDVKFQDFSAMMNDAMTKAQEGMTDDQKKQMQDALKQYGKQ